MIKNMKMKSLHNKLYNLPPGSPLWLPGANWLLYAYPSALKFYQEGDLKQPPLELSWQNGQALGFDQFYLSIDFRRDRIYLEFSSQGVFGRFVFTCSKEKDLLFKLERLRDEKGVVSFKWNRPNLLPPVQVQVEFTNLSCPGAQALPRLKALKDARVGFWSGTNAKYTSAKIKTPTSKAGEIAALGTLWIEAFCFIQAVDLDKELVATLNQVIGYDKVKWPRNWWKLASRTTSESLLPLSCDPYRWGLELNHTHHESYFVAMAYVWMSRWICIEKDSFCFEASAASLFPSGRLKSPLAEGISLFLHWRKHQAREIVITSFEKGPPSYLIKLSPAPKKARLRKFDFKSRTLKQEEVLEVKSELLLDLSSSGYYIVDCFNY